MVLLAAYNVLLFHYTGQEDIVVGFPAAGRPHPDLENVIGMFANTLALRNYPHYKKSFNHFLQNVKENTLEAFENQDYQFEMLVDKVLPERDTSRNPLFDTMFALQNVSIPEIKINDLELTPYKFTFGMSHFDILLAGVEGGEGIAFSLEYSTKLFEREMMEKLSVHFLNLLKEIVKNPGKELSRIDMRSEIEKKKISRFHDSDDGGTYEFE
jgi:non-ribosomal peptide synthetase component F